MTGHSEPSKVEVEEHWSQWGAAAAGESGGVAITVTRQQGSGKVNFKGSCRAGPLASSRFHTWLTTDGHAP
jgi:hypothetical protein